MIVDEVRSFAKDYISNPSARTKERKAKIRQAYRELTGSNLIGFCRTCYIEAVFKILKFNQMALSKYELKKGYVAQFFREPYKDIKAFTNINLQTNPDKYDLVAEEYLRRYPSRSVYFVRMPSAPKPFVPPEIKIVVPEAKEETLKMPEPEEIISKLTEVKPKKTRKK